MAKSLGDERQKYWKELKPGEKIERMRDVVKGLQNSLSAVSYRSRQMEKHTHNDEGEAVEVKRFGYRGGEDMGTAAKSLSEDKDEVYF